MTSVMYCHPIEFWNALIAVSSVVPQQIKLTENDSYNCRLGWYICWARILISMEFTRMKCYYICTVYRVMYTFIVAYITWTWCLPCSPPQLVHADGVLIGGEGEVGVMEGEGEDEGGWDVGDDDLDLPPDLVRDMWLGCSYQLVTTLASQWRVDIICEILLPEKNLSSTFDLSFLSRYQGLRLMPTL